MNRNLYAGSSALEMERLPVSGNYVDFEGEPFYRIENYDHLRPFFISIASNADHWMFISSTGALTAGRRNPDNALFPYCTDDKIHDSAGITGSRTVLVVNHGGRQHIWMPFCDSYKGLYRIRRNLLKSIWGNKIVFEEENESLSLTFRYGWLNSERFGFIRRCWLTNTADRASTARVADGIQNILPSGIGSQFQLEKSTLLDAYKRNELDPETGLGLFTLSSIPIDRPEPAECLKATTVWAAGLPHANVLLSVKGFNSFFEPNTPAQQVEVRGERGAYILDFPARLLPRAPVEWLMAADVNQGHSQVTRIRRLLRQPQKLRKMALADVARGTAQLRKIVASADGLQKTRRQSGDVRHYSNVLFNVMRGGVFADGCDIDPDDLSTCVRNANRAVAARHKNWFKALPHPLPCAALARKAAEPGDPQLERICLEYLPLTFSRRHGDPSRPWNRFSIETRDATGKQVLNYEGNWRDILQNWEALAQSFPDFAPAMLCKFLNASTPDGYNPYRITRDGLDWEVVDPHDPWSFIGYWGDHQVIYLLKLLETVQRHQPETLRRFLASRIFSYANVPYRIKPYPALLKDPRNTVAFDSAADALARKRVREMGSDGKLLLNGKGEIQLANLAEKLLVSILAKLSNFIPEAGIWLNTQRPEWNDANNALVGNGASMVTLCYLRRQFAFLAEIYRNSGIVAFDVSTDVADLFNAVHAIFRQEGARLRICGGKHRGHARISDVDRKRVLDQLGKAGSAYRQTVYGAGLSTRLRGIATSELVNFFTIGMAWLDHSIRANHRADGMFEAYNLIRIEREKIGIRRLYPMLEGQTAVLSSGLLSPEESLAVLQSLRRSPLYRADQHSYLLYPDRDLPSFLQKNQIPPKEIKRSALMRQLLQDGNPDLVNLDSTGRAHFNQSIRNAADVAQRLDDLAAGNYKVLVTRERHNILQLFERLFDHESFTGRSGTFFAYEGLGSIYWHMVSKLLLAAQESVHNAAQSGASGDILARLEAAYHDIRAGLGDWKSPEEYGAFPTDPYSHTPRHKGACQPGLTGQVKEDILCRWGELGVSVNEGQITFGPRLLRQDEFLDNPRAAGTLFTTNGIGEAMKRVPATRDETASKASPISSTKRFPAAVTETFHYIDARGRNRQLRLPPGSLAFTYCQTPIVYTLGSRSTVTVHYANGNKAASPGNTLSIAASQSILSRTGLVLRVELEFRAFY